MSSELYHFGIPLMRWYYRRWQNLDGTLTPEGRERYRQMRKEHKKQVVKDRSTVYEKPKNMTDDELRAAITRLRNEKTYADLVKELRPDKSSRLRRELANNLYKGFGIVSEEGFKNFARFVYGRTTAKPEFIIKEPWLFTDQQVQAAQKRVHALNDIKKYYGLPSVNFSDGKKNKKGKKNGRNRQGRKP